MSKRQKHCRALRNSEFRDHLSENERDALGKLTQRYTKPRDDSPSIDTKSRSSKSHRAHPFVAHKPLKFTPNGVSATSILRSLGDPNLSITQDFAGIMGLLPVCP